MSAEGILKREFRATCTCSTTDLDASLLTNFVTDSEILVHKINDVRLLLYVVMLFI